MLLLILGKGKTGSIVAQVARERGHSVRVLDRENAGASALTAPTLANVDVVIDFTTAEAAVENMRACLAPRRAHRRRHHRLVQPARRDRKPSPSGAKAACSTAPISPSASTSSSR